MNHDEWMLRAVTQAEEMPAFPFGTVIVDLRSQRQVAAGFNKGRQNPTWHGEIDAINQLYVSRDPVHTSSLALYTTAEPCPMCMSAILWCGIATVVYGTSIPTLQNLGWGQIDLRAQQIIERAPFASCELIGGVAEAACDALFLDPAARQG